MSKFKRLKNVEFVGNEEKKIVFHYKAEKKR